MSIIDDRIVDPHLGMAMPEKGYLRDFIEHGCHVSMSPPEFFLAAGLAQISAMLANRATVRLGGRNYPPHLWVILLGPAGAKKSTALALAARILDEALPISTLFPQETSREQLWTTLSTRPTGLMILSEFLAFLSKASRDYMAGLKEDLCEIWDSPEKMERALRSGTTLVRKPAVSIGGAAVPEALGEWVKQRDLSGGFLSRFLFVPQTTPLAYKGLDMNGDAGHSKLTRWLHELYEELPPADKPVRVRFGPEAAARWETYDREILDLPTPLELSGFAGRCGVYALKAAMCYAYAETGNLVPEEHHVDMACGFVEYSRRQVWQMLEDLDPSRDAQDLRRAKATIARLAGSDGWVPSREVMRSIHLVRRRFDEIMDTLASTEQIEVRTTRPEDGGRPSQEVRVSSPVLSHGKVTRDKT